MRTVTAQRIHSLKQQTRHVLFGNYGIFYDALYPSWFHCVQDVLRDKLILLVGSTVFNRPKFRIFPPDFTRNNVVSAQESHRARIFSVPAAPERKTGEQVDMIAKFGVLKVTYGQIGRAHV